jgi:type IV pilus biogenesis protein CpaD/CtpE
MNVRLLVLGFIPVALAACEPPRATLSPSFGNAVRHNIAVQTINPNPNETMIAPDLNGERAAEVMDRYKQGQIKPAPTFAAPTTTSGGGTTAK